MSLREYVSIAFSKTLAKASYNQKQDALVELAAFIEGSPYIHTYCPQGDHVIEQIYPFFTEKFDLSQTFQWEVLGRDLATCERLCLRRMGFNTYAQKAGFNME